jgi:hypothetical protein
VRFRFASSFGLVVSTLLVGCHSEPAREPPLPEPSAPSAKIVSATVVTNDCDRVAKGNARLAEDAMSTLVEGCTSVPGGSARFSATLEPGGRIEIAQTVGSPDTVPICVLKHELRHKVPLTHECKLDVRLEESAVALPDAGQSD